MTAGPMDARDIQAVRLHWKEAGSGISMQVHWAKEGWSEEGHVDDLVGTTGQSRPVDGLRIRLTGKRAATYHICYRLPDTAGTWSEWRRDGESVIREQKINGIQIRLVKDAIKQVYV